MQFGEAFLSLIPQLDRTAVARTDAEAHRAGRSAGKAYSDGMDKGTKSASDRAGAFGTALATMGAKATIGAAGVASVAPAALQLTAAVLPATGAITALPAALLAVKAVSGVVKIAVGGVGEAIKESFIGNPEKALKALEALPPEANKFALSIINIKGGVEDLRTSVSNSLFAPINEEVDGFLTRAIPLANRVLPDMAEALGNTGAQILNVATNGRLLDDVGVFFDNTTRSIQIANDSTGDLTNAFGALLSVGSKALPQLATGFNNGAKAASAFVLEAEKTGQLDRWMQAGLATIGQLFQILKNLGSVVASILKSAGDSSRNFLGTIVDLTAKLAAFLKTAEGTAALKNFFEITGGISSALRQGLLLILPQIGRALAILAPAVQPLIGAFLQLVAAVSPLLPVAARLAVVVASVLAGAMTTLAGALTPMIAKLTGGGSAGEGMERLMDSAEKLGPALNDAAGSVQNLTPALNLTASAIAFMVEHTDTLIKFLPLIVAGFIAWKVAQLAGNVAMAASVPIRIAEIIATRQQTAALTQLAAAQVAATGGTVANTAATGAQTGVTIAQRVATLASSVATGIATAATWLWTAATTALGVAIKFAMGPIGLIIIGITALIAIIVLAYKHNETFRKIVDAVWAGIKVAVKATVDWFVNTAWPALKTAISFLGDVFMWLWRNVIVPAWDGIKSAISVAWTVIKVLFEAGKLYIQALGAVFTWLWKNIIEPVWQGIKLAITVAWKAIEIIFKLVEIGIRAMALVFQWLWQNVIVPVWNGIKLATQIWWNVVKAIFDAVMSFLRGVFAAAWTWIKDHVLQVWTTLRNGVSAAWNWLKNNVLDPIINFLRSTFGPAWERMKDAVVRIWESLKSPLSATWNWIKSNIFEPIQTFITRTIPNAFSTGVSAVGRAWDRIKEAAKIPVKFVIDTVLNKGIIAGVNWIASKVGASTISPIPLPFATGGVLPGYTPGRDVHRFVSATGGALDLSGGEAIMRPEFTKAVGPSFVHGANAAARAGGEAGVKKFLGGFADGGILGSIGDALGSAWDALTNPVDTFKKMVGGLVGKIGGGQFGEILKATVSRLIDGAAEWVTSKFTSFGFGGDLGGGSVGGGGGTYVRMLAALRAGGFNFHPSPGQLTSGGHAPGSYHYSGRAVDLSPPSKEVFNWIASHFGANSAELFYSPMPYYIKHGRKIPGTFPDHYDHVHWAMRNGGIFKYDNGGWFNPGDIGVNRLGKPEAVLTPEESQGLKNMGVGELAELLRELIEEVRQNGHTVGGYIRGSGRGLITRARTNGGV